MDKYTSQEKYQKENIQRVVLKLNKKTDADILDWLNSLDNKQGAIKEAIRDRIEAAKITQRYYADPDKVIPALKVKSWLRSTGGNNCCEEHEEYHDILFDETLDEACKAVDKFSKLLED